MRWLLISSTLRCVATGLTGGATTATGGGGALAGTPYCLSGTSSAAAATASGTNLDAISATRELSRVIVAEPRRLTSCCRDGSGRAATKAVSAGSAGTDVLKAISCTMAAFSAAALGRRPSESLRVSMGDDEPDLVVGVTAPKCESEPGTMLIGAGTGSSALAAVGEAGRDLTSASWRALVLAANDSRARCFCSASSLALSSDSTLARARSSAAAE